MKGKFGIKLGEYLFFAENTQASNNRGEVTARLKLLGSFLPWFVKDRISTRFLLSLLMI